MTETNNSEIVSAKNEEEILNKIHSASNELILLLNKLKSVKVEVEAAVKDLDHNYFIEKSDSFDKFNDIFNDQGINDLISVVDKLCEDVKEDLERTCSEHEFIWDLADTGYDNWVSICYCKNCHLSKKV
jgi:uncharacterized protein (DUF2164 family)